MKKKELEEKIFYFPLLKNRTTQILKGKISFKNNILNLDKKFELSLENPEIIYIGNEVIIYSKNKGTLVFFRTEKEAKVIQREYEKSLKKLNQDLPRWNRMFSKN